MRGQCTDLRYKQSGLLGMCSLHSMFHRLKTIPSLSGESEGLRLLESIRLYELKAGIIPASWQPSLAECEQQFVDILLDLFQISQPNPRTCPDVDCFKVSYDTNYFSHLYQLI